MIAAAERWAEQVAGWGIPDHVLAQAPVSPWAHDPARFALDGPLDTGDGADTPSLAWSREVLPPTGGTVLDVGCGGGRGSIPLAPEATEVCGVDTNGDMLALFAETAAARGLAHRTLLGAWPDVASDAPIADVVVCHHVMYNVADPVPFLVALTGRARLAVVVEMPIRHPLSGWADAWEHFWGIRRPDGPSDLDIVEIATALGLHPEHRRWERDPAQYESTDPVEVVRRRLCLTPDRDAELEEWLAEHRPRYVDTMATLRWPGDA